MLRKRHFVFAVILVLVGFATSAQTPPSAERKFPPFLSWEYFTDDPAAFANFGSVGANILVVFFTAAAVIVSLFIGIKSIRASTRASENLLKTERPYVTGGGNAVKAERTDFKITANADGTETFNPPVTKRVFVVDVGNYGKTPALLTSYDVKIVPFADLPPGPATYNDKKYPRFDWIAPGKEKYGLKRIPFDEGENLVAYGCFWYLDYDRDPHYFRFILSIDERTTHPDMARKVDPSYTKWT